MRNSDIVIIGAGIVGAATALKLKQQYPQNRILILEKESGPAKHQTGRNSGVIHAGVYYAPGSLKAKYCREGLHRTMAFCQENNVDYLQTGKLLVATNSLELQRMQALFERCQQNELEPTMISKAKMRELEPNIVGEGAFLVRQTGIVDYIGMTQKLIDRFVGLGGEVVFHQSVQSMQEEEEGIHVSTTDNDFRCRLLINCAGVYSDRLIRMLKKDIDFAIVPFKGEYFQLPEKYNNIVKHLIYPIPDPELPFLGVHLTRMINGTVTVGPNAVLAFGREAYGKASFKLDDMVEMMSFSGFRKVVAKNLNSGIAELRNSYFKAGYLKQVQKYCPQIQLQDLLPYPPGIRAQAVSNDGQLIHDFKFVETPKSLHVGNAPSPAATSALPIADSICEKLAEKIG